MFIANWLTVSTIQQRSRVRERSNYEKELAVFWATLLRRSSHKQAEKKWLGRCRNEAALNIKPGHTLGIIDALLVHGWRGFIAAGG
uniref:Uncharacterized protein n=1 Tax=Salmonella sp. TaxID=599 RepID=A0A482EW02_SALSP|nr:hypothetical protein NNIBIDOC_00099 [Salmonella sp.]